MENEKISILDLFYYLSETYIDLGILDSNLKSFLKNNFKKVVRKDKNLQVLFTGIRVVKGKPNKVILEYYHTKKDYECFNEVDYVVERIAIYKDKNGVFYVFEYFKRKLFFMIAPQIFKTTLGIIIPAEYRCEGEEGKTHHKYKACDTFR